LGRSLSALSRRDADFQTVHDQFNDRVTLISVYIGPFVGLGNRQDVEDLLEQLDLTYPTGYAAEAGVVRAYRVLGLPTTVFLKPNGEVFRTWIGLLNGDKMVELAQGFLAISGT